MTPETNPHLGNAAQRLRALYNSCYLRDGAGITSHPEAYQLAVPVELIQDLFYEHADLTRRAEAAEQQLGELNNAFDRANLFTSFSKDGGQTWISHSLKEKVKIAINVCAMPEAEIDRLRVEELQQQLAVALRKVEALERLARLAYLHEIDRIRDYPSDVAWDWNLSGAKYKHLLSKDERELGRLLATYGVAQDAQPALPVSNCCSATMRIESSGYGSNYHVCTRCNYPCDAKPADAEGTT